jgi:transcriptional regulator
MYVPPRYRVTDDAEIDAFVRDHGFATLVSHGSDGLMATHVPIELSYDPDGVRVLHGHVSKANPQWRQLQESVQESVQESKEAMLVFLGPHTYISPTWYDHPNVPTWNYQAVHFYGTVQVIAAPEDLTPSLRALSEHYEPPGLPPPRFDLDAMPSDLRTADLKGIVGFSMRVTRVDAAFKLSQNRHDADRARIATELRSRGDDASRQIADAMTRVTRPGR